MLSELSINKLVSEKGHDIGMYAEIIINSDALEVDRLFTYKVPEEFLYTISAGPVSYTHLTLPTTWNV